MGLIAALTEAQTRQHTPKLLGLHLPADLTASSGKAVRLAILIVCPRDGMGQLHHAMMGTASVGDWHRSDH